MVNYTIKASVEESDRIYAEDQMFLIRSNKNHFKAGEYISILTVKNGRPVKHPIESRTYKIACVLDSNDVQIDKEVVLITLRRKS